MKVRAKMTPIETRIISLPGTVPHSKNAHVIVSLPADAWFWLDELVKKRYPKEGYKALIHAFEGSAACPETLSTALRGKAQAHLEHQLAIFYNLANDNGAATVSKSTKLPSLPENPLYPESRMPFAYQLFKFLAHPTHLTTVWERRNYMAICIQFDIDLYDDTTLTITAHKS
jgi:hypothetical protein